MINPTFQYLIYKEQEEKLMREIELNPRINESACHAKSAQSASSRIGQWLAVHLLQITSALSPAVRAHFNQVVCAPNSIHCVCC